MKVPGIGFPASGDGMMRDIYLYDMNTDEELTFEQAAERLELSLDGIVSSWENYGTPEGTPIKSYEELKRNHYTLIIDENNEYKFFFQN